VADEEVVCSEKDELCRELDVEGQSETVREYETHDRGWYAEEEG